MVKLTRKLGNQATYSPTQELYLQLVGEDLDFEGQGDVLADSGDEGVHGENDSVDDIFHAANSMPKDDPELRELVDSAEGKLKKIVLLYTALIKRRMKTFKADLDDDSSVSRVKRLDEIMEHLKQIPDLVDDLASQFYDLDDQEAKIALDKCISQARDAGDLARLDWSQKEDEFTAWKSKWEEAIK